MADEVNLSWITPGADAELLRAWRASPPAFLGTDGFGLVDESYDTLVYKADVTTTAAKIMTFGFGKTVDTLSFTFRAAGDGTTRVSALGQAPEATRAALAQYAADHAAPSP